MKDYIESSMHYYKSIFPTPQSVLSHMFTVLGNGVMLDNKGYINENCRCETAFIFEEPQPLSSVYHWNDNPEFQPFRKLAGCRDVGFKEAAQYFIACIKVTPDTVEGIPEWKRNLHIVEDVLLGTPTITDEFSIDDMDKFLIKIEGEKNTSQTPVDPQYHPKTPPSSVKKVWYFDVQWSDCPVSVKNEVSCMWRDHQLGNDNYIQKVALDEELFEDYPYVYFWLKHKGVPCGEDVVIHYWW